MFKRQPLHSVDLRFQNSASQKVEGNENALALAASGGELFQGRFGEVLKRAHYSLAQLRGIEPLQRFGASGVETFYHDPSPLLPQPGHRASTILSDADRLSAEFYLRELRDARGEYQDLDETLRSLAGGDLGLTIIPEKNRDLFTHEGTQIANKEPSENDPIVGSAKNLFVGNLIASTNPKTDARWTSVEFPLSIQALAIRLVIYENGGGNLVGISKLEVWDGDHKLAAASATATSQYDGTYNPTNVLASDFNLSSSAPGWFSLAAPSSAAPQNLMVQLPEISGVSHIRFLHTDSLVGRQPKTFEVQYSLSLEARVEDPVDSEKWATVDCESGRSYFYLPSASGLDQAADGTPVEAVLIGTSSYAEQTVYKQIDVPSPANLDLSRPPVLAFKLYWEDAISSDNVWNSTIRLFYQVGSGAPVEWTDKRILATEFGQVWHFLPLSWDEVALGQRNEVRFTAQDPTAGNREWIRFYDARIDIPVLQSDLRIDTLLKNDEDNQIPRSASALAFKMVIPQDGAPLKRGSGLILGDVVNPLGSVSLHPSWDGYLDNLTSIGNTLKLIEATPGVYYPQGVYESSPFTVASALRRSFTHYLLSASASSGSRVELWYRGAATQRGVFGAEWLLADGASGEFDNKDMAWMQVRLVLKAGAGIAASAQQSASGEPTFIQGTFNDLEMVIEDDLLKAREEGIIPNYNFYRSKAPMALNGWSTRQAAGSGIFTSWVIGGTGMAVVSPVMTSNTTPDPYKVQASSEYNATYQAWKAFDLNPANAWASVNAAGPHWLKIDLGFPQILGGYRLDINTAYPTTAPKDWFIEGSNDESTWDNIDTQNNHTDWVEYKEFTVNSFKAYRFYRIYILSNSGYGAGETDIYEFTLYPPNYSLSRLVPKMAGPNTPAPYTASGSAWYNGNYAPWKVFDRSSGTTWATPANVSTGFISIDLGMSQTAFSYEIRSEATQPTDAPRDWKLEGAADGTNWMTLDERKDMVFKGGELRRFEIASPGSYRFYRLNISKNSGYNNIHVAEFQLYSPASGAKADLVLQQKDSSVKSESVLATSVFYYEAPARLHLKEAKTFSISVPGRAEIRVKRSLDNQLLHTQTITPSASAQVVTIDNPSIYGNYVYFEIVAINGGAS